MTFTVDKIFRLKLKEVKTRKRGWLDFSTKTIKMVHKKDASSFIGEKTLENITKVIEKNPAYKIIEVSKETALFPVK